MTGNNITNVAEPDSPSDAATKDYIDAAIARMSVDREIFVTSNKWSGDLGGLSGADNKCQTYADYGDVSGTYKAVLSTNSVNATDRFDFTWHDRIVMANGTTVAGAGEAIWQKGVPGGGDDDYLLNSINQNAVGYKRSGEVWTGTNTAGKFAGEACSSWTDGTFGPDGYAGKTSKVDASWVENGINICGEEKRLYCLETK